MNRLFAAEDEGSEQLCSLICTQACRSVVSGARFPSVCTRRFAMVIVSRFFSRCASERESSERERCASSSVPFAISRFFAIFSRFFVIFAIFRDFFAIFRSRSRFAKNTGVHGLKSPKIQVCTG